MSDTRTVNLVLPMPPSANDYWRIGLTGKGRPFPYLTGNAKKYKVTVAEIAEIETPIYGEVSVTLNVFFERRGCDLDNRNKVLLDALQKVVYNNDRQVAELHSYRHLDPKKPRVEVEIREIEGKYTFSDLVKQKGEINEHSYRESTGQTGKHSNG